jgi:alpha-galactosidase/6-phospho-beta-glucosidase family protein
MTGRDVVLIGAGSTVFTPGLLSDLASSRVFDDSTIHLVDLDADAADTMARLGRRIAAERGSSMRVEPHVDRREALPGAALVTTTIAVGGADGWRADLDIPAKYGVRQTVGDTVGPGGVLRALRHVPELLAIAADIADLAPNAWLVNYTNPLTANVRAITREMPVRTIGLCHGTMHTRAALARGLGLQPAEVHTVFAGLNHLCWLLDIRHGTEDLYPRLRAAAATEASGGPQAAVSRGEGLHQAVSADLLATYGRYPAPGDRHVAEFFAWYLNDGGSDAGLSWGLQGGLDMTREYIGEKSTLWDRLHEQADGRRPIDPSNQEGERVVAIAEALFTGRDLVELAVNVPNHGAIANLPDEAVVEVPAVVGAAGVTALAVGALPPAITGVLTTRIMQQELTVQAAVSGDRATAIQALCADPLVPNPRTARAILDDATAA